MVVMEVVVVVVMVLEVVVVVVVVVVKMMVVSSPGSYAKDPERPVEQGARREGRSRPSCECKSTGNPTECSYWENERRKQDEGQKEGSCMAEDYAVDIEHESSNRFEEYEWCEQKWIRATTLLEDGFRGSGFIMCKNPDSDADMDVDGGDTLEYGKPQFTEADVIPCTGEEPAPASHLSSLNGPVMRGRPPAMDAASKDSDIEKITEDSAVTTPEALKARVRELE
ncbi:LOW QUALITY PROTEIN: hypothetical protein ACRRTK_012604 [Alexandromys fortis]